VLSIEIIEALLVVAAIVAILARRIRLPYTAGLVLAGAGLASVGLLDGIPLTKDLIFRALLPPLIFEAALFIEWKELKRELVPVLVLASLGVVIGAVVVSASMRYLGNWTWPAALLFGILIAATDPVSVIAMFKELKLEGRLRLLVEAESLFNDGVAAVLFSIAILFATGTQLDSGVVLSTLLREVGGGVACGAGVAGLALFLAGRTDDHLVELTFTTATAFGSFLLADHFHCSGVMATLVAGLMVGNMGHIGSATDLGRDTVSAFWEFAAFVSNSIIFLLIGIREHALGEALWADLELIGIAIAAMFVGRAVAVYGISGLFTKSKHRIDLNHQHVLIWGGLKGALSLALVLGLPEEFPMRHEIVVVTFGVVAFSVIVQGITMPMLTRRLGILGASKESGATLPTEA
jgi:CPA1 family monovalent cation:H+ antiporter